MRHLLKTTHERYFLYFFVMNNSDCCAYLFMHFIDIVEKMAGNFLLIWEQMLERKSGLTSFLGMHKSAIAVPILV